MFLERSFRPTAAARCFHKAAIPTTAVLRDLPKGQFKLIGLNGRWRTKLAPSAMSRFPVVDQEHAANDHSALHAIVGPDPDQSVNISESGKWTFND